MEWKGLSTKFMTLHDEILEKVPDFTSWDEALLWIQKGQQAARELDLESEFISLEWSEIEQERAFPFGLYSSEKWRKFVLAVFLADLVSYSEPVDQVNFDRLLFIMHAFPQGFRTWWIKHQNGLWWPVGYTGWYPMLETSYELFQKNPEKLKDRMVVPNLYADGGKSYLYLFNYSVAPALKKSSLSKVVVKRFVQDISVQNARGLACVTVSEDGVRIADRLGMTCAGNFVLDGSSEGVYVK